MGTYDAVGPEIQAAVDPRKQNSQPAMTDHAQRAKEMAEHLIEYMPGRLLSAESFIPALTEFYQDAHAAGRRAGLEEAAQDCQRRQGFCQAVLDTADHRRMAPGELQGWHWKKDLLAALVEWCRATAKEGA